MSYLASEFDELERELNADRDYHEMRAAQDYEDESDIDKAVGEGVPDEEEDEDEDNDDDPMQREADAEADGMKVDDGKDFYGNPTAGHARIVLPPIPEVLSLDPGTLLINPLFHSLRDWNDGLSKQEMTIPQLAESMHEIGQQQRVQAYLNEEGDAVVYIGERRVAAGRLIRDELNSNFEILVELHRDLDEDGALQRLLHENWQREDPGPMEKARAIALVRERHKWKGTQGTEKVAAYFGVHPATIQNAEFVAADPVLVEAVMGGKMTFDAAVDLARAKKPPQSEVQAKTRAGNDKAGAPLTAEEKAQVLDKAKELAAADPKVKKAAEKDQRAKDKAWMKEDRARSKARKAKEKAEKLAAKGKDKGKGAKVDKAGAGDGPRVATEAEIDAIINPQVLPVVPTPPPVVASRHIRKALQQTGLGGVSGAPKMSEAIELYESLKGVEDGTYPNAMNRHFEYFCRWAKGDKKTSDKGLVATFDDMADQMKPMLGHSKLQVGVEHVGKGKPKTSKPASKPTAKPTAKPKAKAKPTPKSKK